MASVNEKQSVDQSELKKGGVSLPDILYVDMIYADDYLIKHRQQTYQLGHLIKVIQGDHLIHAFYDCS